MTWGVMEPSVAERVCDLDAGEATRKFLRFETRAESRVSKCVEGLGPKNGKAA